MARPVSLTLQCAMLLFMALFMFLGHSRSLTADEYLEMKRLLKSLNKPALKSIKTENRDIFDCVDIYKQPAFDHPLMQNYTIPKKPTFPPKWGNAFVPSNASAVVRLPDGGCPDGTVPIRRVKMEDLLRAPSISYFGKKHGINGSSSGGSINSLPDNHHWAKIDTKPGDFYGTSVHMNVWKPNVGSIDKSSSAKFWLVSGPEDQLNTIEAGWTVDGRLYGDLEPRIFIYWTSDGYGKTGCYNTLCSGFVSVHREVPIGAAINPISKEGGDQFAVGISVWKDPTEWWLYINDEVVGFWPYQFFNHLNQKADLVMWGGEVYSPNGQGLPPMGSGIAPGGRDDDGWQKACYMNNIFTVNNKNEYVVGPKDTDIFIDRRKCYNLVDLGVVDNPNWGRSFYFGGQCCTAAKGETQATAEVNPIEAFCKKTPDNQWLCDFAEMSCHPSSSSSSSSSSMANRSPIIAFRLQKQILVWLVICVAFSEGNSVSKEEYLKLKRHLKFLNKPAVKSIETDYGDIFDCVDMNKQLAFDHPALKNHTIQMKPSSLPKRNGNENFSAALLDIGLPGEGCPKGTVPIRRVKMEELMRAPSLSDFGKKYFQNGTKPFFEYYNRRRHHHWAQDDTDDGIFYGAKVGINLWEPNVPSNSEFSLAKFWLTSGFYEQLNTIEAGWLVYPRLFLDNHVHLFALWTADGYRSGCFNLYCPGFVQVSDKVPLGTRLTPPSTFGGVQYEIELLAFLDPVTKDWWLAYGDETVGYWPHTLFNSLSTKADRVHWGGEVFTPDDGVGQDMPQMCSGHFPEEGYKKACLMRKMQIVKEGNLLVDAPETTAFADEPSCYNAIDKGRVDGWGRTFYFGGPGGKCMK
ncbi:uncharacterized protein [Aristolochia californica]|uniref:uncharacterized protein n=1 Tax=Aristolochia californica TaxID=171875 RepID=UPI0035E068FB